jgi:hypothetical protein
LSGWRWEERWEEVRLDIGKEEENKRGREETHSVIMNELIVYQN